MSASSRAAAVLCLSNPYPHEHPPLPPVVTVCPPWFLCVCVLLCTTGARVHASCFYMIHPDVKSTCKGFGIVPRDESQRHSSLVDLVSPPISAPSTIAGWLSILSEERHVRDYRAISVRVMSFCVFHVCYLFLSWPSLASSFYASFRLRLNMILTRKTGRSHLRRHV